jgi:hypothetical protein
MTRKIDRRQALSTFGTVSLTALLAGDERATSPTAMPDAVVDIWHCDALGPYSVSFDDDVAAAGYERDPYARHAGRDVFNTDDSIFDEAVLLDLSPDGDAYDAAISVDVAAA